LVETEAVIAPRGRLRNPESRAALGVLIALTAIAPMSIDMFLPSMPEMADDFHTSKAAVSLAVTLFLLAFAGSQLLYGPASDRFGRRPVLFAGMGLYIVGGLLSLFAFSVGSLIAGRIVQGLGGGAGPAVSTAIIIDVYRRERAMRAMAVMTVVTAVAPMVGPVLGGVLHDLFGWRAVFVTMVGIGFALVLTYATFLPETNHLRDPAALRLRRMVGNYRVLWSTPVFAAHAGLLALQVSGMLIFISTSSFVLVDDLGLSPKAFGLAFGLVAFGIMGGATIARRMAGHWSPRRIVLTATTAGAVATTTMAIIALSGVSEVALIVGPMVIGSGSIGMSGPAARATALTPFPEMAGLASAVMGFSQIGGAALYSIGFNVLFEPSPKTMTTAIAVASVSACLVAWLVAGRGIQRTAAT
jgi:DHA1 family bicyclomycin/chloramphenicol resistance-like MFS transporter